LVKVKSRKKAGLDCRALPFNARHIPRTTGTNSAGQHQPNGHDQLQPARNNRAGQLQLSGSSFQRPEANSENLTHHHRRHGRKQGDSESGEWVLTLGDGHAGDYAGADAGDGQLGEQFTAGVGAGAWGHRGTNNWLDGKG
jgi:hypothetical protein